MSECIVGLTSSKISIWIWESLHDVANMLDYYIHF